MGKRHSVVTPKLIKLYVLLLPLLNLVVDCHNLVSLKLRIGTAIEQNFTYGHYASAYSIFEILKVVLYIFI